MKHLLHQGLLTPAAYSAYSWVVFLHSCTPAFKHVRVHAYTPKFRSCLASAAAQDMLNTAHIRLPTRLSTRETSKPKPSKPGARLPTAPCAGLHALVTRTHGPKRCSRQCHPLPLSCCCSRYALISSGLMPCTAVPATSLSVDRRLCMPKPAGARGHALLRHATSRTLQCAARRLAACLAAQAACS